MRLPTVVAVVTALVASVSGAAFGTISVLDPQATHVSHPIFPPRIAYKYIPQRDGAVSCLASNERISPNDTMAYNETRLNLCLQAYDLPFEDGRKCGRRQWYRGFKIYAQPHDCYVTCRGCIQEGIRARAAIVQCEHSPPGTLSMCWTGFTKIG
ncbi:MAG: hypothetical protein M1832_004639 [Thelocarpon impressellum]|nr:MAG: hypothetical protein M1832_004639 [Thelocarpon impressellum]